MKVQDLLDWAEANIDLDGVYGVDPEAPLRVAITETPFGSAPAGAAILWVENQKGEMVGPVLDPEPIRISGARD